MCKTQCVLALLALSVGVAHSWDIAVTSGDRLEFFLSNGTKSQTEESQFRDLTLLAYDAVHNMLLFVDKQSDNASIFSFNITSKKYQSLVAKKAYENIQGLAFDPVKGLLFWTDTNDRSIYWISLKPGYKNHLYGNLLIKMDDELPRAIAVDSCRGYVYWTNTNVKKPTIERALYDGTKREVIVDNNIYMPVSLAIDQQTKKLYWADDREGIHYSIESADLDGTNRKTLLTGIHHQPNTLTVSKDSIYWVDWGFKSVWQLPKNPPIEPEPVQISSFPENPFGIAANYKIEDQIQGIEECQALKSLPQNNTEISDSSNVPKDVGLFCVHGTKVNGKLLCKCTLGYTGDRCDISVCQNYCFQGDCGVNDKGKPECRCNAGYSGQRCEVNECHGYCLNNGACSLNEKNERECQCIGDFEGSRCETPKVFTTTTMPTTTAATTNSTPSPTTTTTTITEAPATAETNTSCQCNNTDSEDEPRSSMSMSSQSAIIETCGDGWDSVRDPIIIILAIICSALFLACVVLVTKILQLKKRPRIKKRIIVNKNVTPMTARPDQCEITIENCCNMNICETPCFEPRSTIRPSLLDSKPGKEEKKNLIANMEYPDDPY
ncbi:protein cueball isoform X1 [Spodoptera frugiperda]|uniref:Protein cueball n=1 Tax=Spodoptera frugiperda TaxID=7108 RepID=A0A9R0EMF4_SPOFR|nr:protein cueball isoform X1 [Spodoptera frugiperda]